MKTYYGTGVGNSSVSGKLVHYSRTNGVPEARSIADTESEKSRFRLAKFIAVGELKCLYEKTLAELGESAAMIFYIHQIMLEDDTYTDMVCSIIDGRKINAERAVYDTCSTLAGVFEGLDDGYMRERRADVWDISERVIAILKSDSRSYPVLSEPSIILSDDLSPSELLLPEKELITGIVLTKGSTNSHTAILALKMNIPMLVNVDLTGDTLANGTAVTIDTDKGVLIIE
ncbi:MAG: hypothetical protein IJ366_01065 [Clostridia bacterium]|nr:hypothetical protein [Clostridia bacterium]